ncbi:MAG TPA: methyltransferase [Euzebya sp.]|nr:methyltransferase [Euzebya sp.]
MAGELLGVPVLPPARVTRAMVRFRAALAGGHRRLALPPVLILEGLFGLMDNRVLGLLVELDLPELLDRSRSLGDLAEATETDPDRLERLLRYAVIRGFIRLDRRGRYAPNAVSRMLRRDHPGSFRGWVEFAGSPWFWDSWRHLKPALSRDGPAGIEAATGHPFFEYVNDIDPAAGAAFNAAMEAGGRLQALGLTAALDWNGIDSVCDVGGGTGATLTLLLTEHPHLKGVLFDLPQVIAQVQPALRDGPLATRCRREGGDFFTAVPRGCDRYLMLTIIHDWADESARRILRVVGEELAPDARIIVVESVLPDTPRDEFVVASDLLMLALASGRERTNAQFHALFKASGLSVSRCTLLATGSTAFELARSSS